MPSPVPAGGEVNTLELGMGHYLGPMRRMGRLNIDR